MYMKCGAADRVVGTLEVAALVHSSFPMLLARGAARLAEV